MHLTEADVREIATYVCIGLPEEEIKSMTRDLNDIIDSLKPLTTYELEGVEPTYHPIANLSNVMRDDVLEPGFTQAEALANTSSVEDGQFKIPPILGSGGGN